jgi:hypothetical protein
MENLLALFNGYNPLEKGSMSPKGKIGEYAPTKEQNFERDIDQTAYLLTKDTPIQLRAVALKHAKSQLKKDAEKKAKEDVDKKIDGINGEVESITASPANTDLYSKYPSQNEEEYKSWDKPEGWKDLSVSGQTETDKESDVGYDTSLYNLLNKLSGEKYPYEFKEYEKNKEPYPEYPTDHEKYRLDDLSKYDEQIKENLNQKDKYWDLSPIMQLTDAWTGSNFAANYKNPNSREDQKSIFRRAELNKLRDREWDIKKYNMGLVKESDKASFVNKINSWKAGEEENQKANKHYNDYISNQLKMRTSEEKNIRDNVIKQLLEEASREGVGGKLDRLIRTIEGKAIETDKKIGSNERMQDKKLASDAELLITKIEGALKGIGMRTGSSEKIASNKLTSEELRQQKKIVADFELLKRKIEGALTGIKLRTDSDEKINKDKITSEELRQDKDLIARYERLLKQIDGNLRGITIKTESDQTINSEKNQTAKEINSAKITSSEKINSEKNQTAKEINSAKIESDQTINSQKNQTSKDINNARITSSEKINQQKIQLQRELKQDRTQKSQGDSRKDWERLNNYYKNNFNNEAPDEHTMAKGERQYMHIFATTPYHNRPSPRVFMDDYLNGNVSRYGTAKKPNISLGQEAYIKKAIEQLGNKYHNLSDGKKKQVRDALRNKFMKQGGN